ncbi:hypothetical protein [Luteimicrobium sp. DT211]|uniref:hypothetical protein n=1 Tax=Luteimicrobium sp. DT211 TaxID=3393412 RepID=UPI003CE88E34
MTYGEVTRELHDALGWLLRRTRHQNYMGGPDRYRPGGVLSVDERTAISEQMMRYRAVVLRYGSDVLDLATGIDSLRHSRGKEVAVERVRAWRPVTQLQGAYERTFRYMADRPDGALPTAEEMATPQSEVLPEAWRQAAVAAMRGRERDLPGAGSWSIGERVAAIGDAAQTARALIILDRRYASRSTIGDTTYSTPGWVRLPNDVTLNHAADACASWARTVATRPDFRVDQSGYTPPPRATAEQYLPGATGAAAALHNAAARLDEPLHARALRSMVHAQRYIAAHAVRLAGAGSGSHLPELTQRAAGYEALDRVVRNIAGTAGEGSPALPDVAESLQIISTTPTADPRELAELTAAGRTFDGKFEGALRRGIRAGHYLRPTGTKQLAAASPGGVRQATEVYTTVDQLRMPELYEALATLPRPATDDGASIHAAGAAAREEFAADIAVRLPGWDRQDRPAKRDAGPISAQLDELVREKRLLSARTRKRDSRQRLATPDDPPTPTGPGPQGPQI